MSRWLWARPSCRMRRRSRRRSALTDHVLQDRSGAEKLVLRYDQRWAAPQHGRGHVVDQHATLQRVIGDVSCGGAIELDRKQQALAAHLAAGTKDVDEKA